MHKQRHFILMMALVGAAAISASVQDAAPVVGPASAQSAAASIPDFFGIWNHPSFPWFEPPSSGPGPITNLSRWAEQRPAGASGSAGLPPSEHGISDYDQLVGDYKNPILQPWAAVGGEEVRPNLARRHHLPEPIQPVLARTRAVHF